MLRAATCAPDASVAHRVPMFAVVRWVAIFTFDTLAYNWCIQDARFDGVPGRGVRREFDFRHTGKREAIPMTMCDFPFADRSAQTGVDAMEGSRRAMATDALVRGAA
jgi:hypothetical protein